MSTKSGQLQPDPFVSRNFPQTWEKLGDERKRIFKESFFPTSADYAADEKEIEKVPHIAEGLLQTMQDETIEERLFNELNDILSQLRKIDLQILFDRFSGQYPRTRSEWEKFYPQRGISKDELIYINSKLEKLNLLTSNRESETERLLKRLSDEISRLQNEINFSSKNGKKQVHVGQHHVTTQFNEFTSISDLGNRMVQFAGCERLLAR